MSERERQLAWGGIIGPVGFVLSWIVWGVVASNYTALDDAISELAASNASTRWGMTAGFLCFTIGVGLFSLCLRRAVPGPAWISALVSAFAVLGAAIFPLGSEPWATIHGVFAGTGYIAHALTPLLAAREFARTGQRGWTGYSVATSLVSAVALLYTLADFDHGMFQRIGLTVTDIWLVAAAVTILRTGQLVGGQATAATTSHETGDIARQR